MATGHRIILGLMLACGVLVQANARTPENPRRFEIMGTVEFVGPLATTVRIDGRDYRLGDSVKPCRLGPSGSRNDDTVELERGQRVSFMVSNETSTRSEKPEITGICVIEGER